MRIEEKIGVAEANVEIVLRNELTPAETDDCSNCGIHSQEHPTAERDVPTCKLHLKKTLKTGDKVVDKYSSWPSALTPDESKRRVPSPSDRMAYAMAVS